MSPQANISSIADAQSDTLYSALPREEASLDEARIASMADEGGVSAAFIETCEPCIEIDERAARSRWQLSVLGSAFAGALVAIMIGAFALARRWRT